MQPTGAAGRRGGETPALGTRSTLTGNQKASVLPPSTVIRSRFRNFTERPPVMTTARGTKRYMVDDDGGARQHVAEDSPSGHATQAGARPSWAASLETPIRGSQLGAPLVDTILRPQRLFAFTSPSPSSSSTSPARSILESTQRGSDHVARVEQLKRELERAKFELAQVELARERDHDAAMSAKHELEASLLAQTKRVERLERDQKWMVEQEERLVEQQRSVERKLGAQQKKYEAKIDDAKARAAELERRVDEANGALRRARAEYVEKAEEQQTRLAEAERAIAELRAQTKGEPGADPALQYTVGAQRREIEARDRDIAELQQRLQALSGGGSDSAHAATPSQGRVAQLERDLHEQCAYMRAVEQQNRQLRADYRRMSEQASKYEREHEMRTSLEAKALRLEARLEGFADTEARLAALHQEREQWERVFRGADAELSAEPLAVAKTVAAQRLTIETLEAKLDTLQRSVDKATDELQSAAADAQQARKECARLEHDVRLEQQRAARLETTRQHAEREAAFLREQLHSYDAEEASMMDGNYDRQKAERISQLELFIDEQRAWIASIDKEPIQSESKHIQSESNISASLLRGYREEAELKQRELDAARDEHERLAQRFEALERETARLEHQVGSGLGYNPRTTRILQLIDNPSARDYAIRSEKLAALSAENEALLERLRRVENVGAQPSDTNTDTDMDAASPFFHTIDNLRAENQSLSKQLEDSAKLISRLKREWKKKATELRDVVYLILGYRVDFLSNGSVRFTSTYAADVDQSFVFTSGDGDQGVMRLLGGGSKTYLKGLGNDIRYWVQERGSIPGFLATVTLQNFDAQPDKS
ncbi:coiled-coil domain-containing protein mad1 [Coemansia erecta]|nr:coiled-coil domain-containing protein mad1 [Coemansia erecta]